jgi:hypothetical protein
MKRSELWSSIEESLRKTPGIQAPPDLADEVIKKVRERAVESGDPAPAFWVFKAKPLLAAAAVLIISLAFLWIYQKPVSDKNTATAGGLKQVKLSVAFPAAQNVSVVGDFNMWNREEHMLRREENGSWSITLSLKAGCYQYLFLVDNKEWKVDPGNTVRIPDGFGGFNSGMEI